METKIWSKKEVFTKITKVIENLLLVSREKNLKERPKVVASARLMVDLAMDSLELMDLVGLVESEFNIAVDVEELASKSTVQDVADYLAVKLKAK
jgi:acyl carrier protein